MSDIKEALRTSWIDAYIVQLDDTMERIPHILAKQPTKSKACHKRIERLIGHIEHQALGKRL